MRSPHGPGIIGDMDTLIAATALEHDCVVVTLDGDFLGVPDLRVQRLDRADL
jgi:predicted nucleic acid-binding protein